MSKHKKGHGRAVHAAGYTTIMNHSPNHGKAVITIVMSVLIWIGMCVGIWFLTKYQIVNHRIYRYVNISTPELVNQFCLTRTLILGLAEFPLMVWAMIEYLFCYHKRSGQRDKYKWYVTPVAVLVTALILFMIVESAVLSIGWITVIQLSALLIVIFVPRVCFRP